MATEIVPQIEQACSGEIDSQPGRPSDGQLDKLDISTLEPIFRSDLKSVHTEASPLARHGELTSQ